MKKSLLIWIIAIILTGVALYVTSDYAKGGNTSLGKSPSSDSNKIQNGVSNNNSDIKAIDFTLTDLDGNKVSLSDFKGKNVYLNFFATWCPPCKQEMPDIEKLYQEYKDKDLVVLAVDLGEDKDTVKNFIKQNNYNFNVLLDSDTNVAQKYNITSIPVSYFIDKNGKVVARRVGAMTASDMKSYISLLYK